MNEVNWAIENLLEQPQSKSLHWTVLRPSNFASTMLQTISPMVQEESNKQSTTYYTG